MRRKTHGLACVAALLAPGWAMAAATQAPPADPTVTYPVQRGDTLYDLAQTYFLRLNDYREVQRLNRIRSPRRLPVGFSLKVPTRFLRIEPIEGRVADVSGEATLAAQGQSTRVQKGQAVREGAEISTGANAFVRIELPDRSYVTLPSQSRFAVETLRRTPLTGVVERSFILRSGRSEAVVTPMTQARDRFVIKTPLSVAAVRGTMFRVDFDPQIHQATTEVVEGTVGVSSTVTGDTVAVTRAFGVHAGDTGVQPLKPLLAPPQLSEPARVQDEAHLAFAVVPVAGAQGYQARLSRDAGMLSPIGETRSATPQLDLDGLANGTWFLQLTAIDADGFEGLPTVYGFERVLHTLRLQEPAAVRRDARRGWLFRWMGEGAGEHRYRFQLSAEGAATPMLDEAGLTEEQITVTDLPDGVYSWRVRSTLLVDGKQWEKWSPARQFRIGR